MTKKHEPDAEFRLRCPKCGTEPILKPENLTITHNDGNDIIRIIVECAFCGFEKDIMAHDEDQE